MLPSRRRRLFEDRGQASEHFGHDGCGNGFQTAALPGREVEGAGLVAADHTVRSRSDLL